MDCTALFTCLVLGAELNVVLVYSIIYMLSNGRGVNKMLSRFSEWVTVFTGESGLYKHRQVKIFRKGEIVLLPEPPSDIFFFGLTVYKNKVRAWLGGDRLECQEIDPFKESPKWKKCLDISPIANDLNVIQVLDDIWVFDLNKIYVVPPTGNVSEFKWPHDILYSSSCLQTNGIITLVIPTGSRHVYINSDATSPQSWEQLATIPTLPNLRACILIESSLYVTGGGYQDSYIRMTSYNESYVIDIESGNVKTLGDTLDHHYGHAMGIINGEPTVIGSSRDTTEVLDVATGTWRAGPTIFGMNFRPAAVSFAIN